MKVRIGEVRDYKKDPTKSGRPRIRFYGEQNDEQEVKDDQLPYGLLMHPTNSPATQKLGMVPTGLPVGTRVVCIFMEEDVNCLYPIVIGTIARGDLDEG
jgi:hypothetical protein